MTVHKRRKGILKGYALLIALLACSLLATVSAQVGLNGPTSVIIGTSYSYTPTYNNLASYSYSGTYSYTITGGVVTGTSNTTKSGTCSGVIGSAAVSITWNSTSGSVYFTCSLGSKTLSITGAQPLSGGTITTSNQSINYGTSPGQISATAATGGASSPTYTYTWQYSYDGVTWTSILSTNVQNYTPGALNLTTYFRRMVTETSTGATAYTGSITITVYPQLTCTITPSGKQTVASGTTATPFTSTVSGGNGTYTYQWQSSSDQVTWTNQVTTSGYSPGVMTATKYFRLTATSNGASVTSAVDTIQVSAYPSASLAITNTTRVDSGSTNVLTVTPGGGNGTYSYVWYQSIDGGTTYSVISGATTNTYTASNVVVSTQYYVAVTSNGLTTNSNVVAITMPTAPVITASDTIACNGASVTLTATGGSGSYRWYKVGDTTLLGTNATLITSVGATYYAVSINTYGISKKSNLKLIQAITSPTAGTIIGNTVCMKNSTIQLSNPTPGGTWSSSNTAIAKVSSTGVVSGVAEGTATITYTVQNACGISSKQLAITVVPLSSYVSSLGIPVQDPLLVDTISLAPNSFKEKVFSQDTLYSSAHTITNVLAFKVIEETSKYIPGDFTSTVALRIVYGHTPTDTYQIDTLRLTVNYTKAAATKYNALQYLNIDSAEYTKITVLSITAPTTVNGVSFDTKQVLLLTNTMLANRYYQLADNKKPVLTDSLPGGVSVPDGVYVKWTFPLHTNHNTAQLEWTWLENEMAGTYSNGSTLDTALLFKRGATRVDIPGGSIAGMYTVPLLYPGIGKLFVRMRAVNILPSGTTSYGPWSGVLTRSFTGHSDSLNWQVSTSFAEEGKRKTVIQYFDGTLRGRQTVTKDNTTQTTVIAETMYDAQGRPAVQILPAPNLSNVVAYAKNFNTFNGPIPSTNPLDNFDFSTPELGNYATGWLKTDTGAGKYYSGYNAEKATSVTAKNIPNANGYPFTVTRYTPDATGRILMQSGVGDSLRMGGAHTTKYYYGTAGQEELDALFGTEVGNYTHYFKNLVQDANGQMSVSYVDMHGRTIATALAGEAPSNTQALPIADASQYNNQAGKVITRKLLDKGTNVLKGNTVESINTVLVPFKTLYTFNYNLPKRKLRLPTCSGDSVTYYCKYNLDIAIIDDSGDSTAKRYQYTGIDTINFTTALTLPVGSYTIRKSLVINQDSLAAYMAKYDSISVGICQTQQYITDSIAAADSLVTGCTLPTVALTCQTCLDSLGTYSSYKYKYAISLGIDSSKLTPVQRLENRNQFVADSLFCRNLNTNVSHTLDNIRLQMLADFTPYTGQYARDTGTTAMYMKFNIFSTTGGPSGKNQPYYKYPLNNAGAADKYYDAYGNYDTLYLPAKLTTLSMAGFRDAYQSSWANSLLAYHPEKSKLDTAYKYLQPTYNYIDSIAQSNILAFNPIPADPFFTTISTGADKDSINKYSSVAWSGTYSMWKMAYAYAFGCNTMGDAITRKACYDTLPSQFTPTNTTLYNGYTNQTLTTALQAKAWSMYLGYYTSVRGDMVNKYLNGKADSSNNASLIAQGFLLHFPTNSVQRANNLGWSSWAPGPSGTPPAVSLSDSLNKYSTNCSSYINGWKQALLQCSVLAALDSNKRTTILNSITSKMVQVCQNGKDAANPSGSSTVSPANSGATYKSFEDVINLVLDSAGISPKDQFCNPYTIQFPKPYGTGTRITQTLVSSVDSCTCSQFSKIQDEIAAAGRNNFYLDSVNNYLRNKYKDTISTELWAGLSKCSVYYTYNCVTTVDTSIKGKPFTITKCDTLKTFPLANPAPLPEFLTCGFSVYVGCYSCTAFKSLDSAFYQIYNKRPVFNDTLRTDSIFAINALYARYLNFKTGLQYSWQYYAAKFKSDSCALGGLLLNSSKFQICLDKTPLNDTTGLAAAVSPCQQVRNQAAIKAANIYAVKEQQLLANFLAAYMAKCVDTTETFTVVDTVKEYHYTLYYYDQAGNLIKTVPPKGVNPIYRTSFIDSVENFKLIDAALIPKHTYVTRYTYNALNQVSIQKTPDGGTSRFWYDRLGRLVISQNAYQLSLGGNVYSYTSYDSLGRITEVGQLSSSTPISDTKARSADSLTTWLAAAANSRTQFTQTVYDTAYLGFVAGTFNQANLRNRVSYSKVFRTTADALGVFGTYYSYDIHGNVNTLLQDFGPGAYNAMNGSNNRFKRIDYDYDLISGKVNQVSYQPGRPDAYYHRYAYDGENRLTDVYSGRDTIQLLLFPEREAHYGYYKHGPLARTDLGQLQVQGQDYVYTLQGWLKAVNPVMGGTLVNGTDTTEAFPVAQDVYGYSLHYFKRDYTAISDTTKTASVLSGLGASAAPLFNGNIAAMAVNLPKFGTPRIYNYKYDQLNRLVSMDAYTGLTPTTASFTPVSITDYKETVAYDPNGNIRTYLRNGDATRTAMDNLTYSYNSGTNQLNRVVDTATDATTNYSLYNDIKKGQAVNNYQYDAIGNLISDASEGISKIDWTVYGKINYLVKGADTIRYAYDAAGNRIMKQTPTDTTFYVRDATGNVLSVYTKPAGGSLAQTELHLYGSSRLGMATQHLVGDVPVNYGLGYGTGQIRTFTRGEKLFELSNHLGNVLVTISDRRQQNSAGGTVVDSYAADVLNANDYYPFGMQMPGRKFAAGTSGYRYGFNGKENDNEVSGSGNQYDYGFRIYNPRIGRFLSVDPLTNKYPELTPFQFAGNMPILAIDLDGEEGKIVTVYHSAITGGEFFRTTVTSNSVIAQFANTTQTIHKYAFSTPKGIEYRQVGPTELTFNQPVNFQTGRIDLSKQTLAISSNSFVFGKKVTPEFRNKVSSISKNLGMDPNNLMTIIAFETGGTFSPSKKNAAGSSGTGLIQFMKSTANALGTSTEELSKMSGVEQLDYVEKYLSTYKGKMNTLEDAYMAVLFPKAVGKDLDYVMFTQYKINKDGINEESLEYKQNAGLDTDHDGNITKKEVSAVIHEKYKQGQKHKN